MSTNISSNISHNISRGDILRELELLPAWRLRESLPTSNNLSSLIPPSADIQNKLTSDAAPEKIDADASLTEILPALKDVTETDELSAEIALPVLEGNIDKPDREALVRNLEWPALQDSVRSCDACGLAETRTPKVFGTGDLKAEWIFVGGAAGELEGTPAGVLLDNMLIAMQLRRGQNVYITHILKCRPTDNREEALDGVMQEKALKDEIKQCSPYLMQQVALIKPKMIIALGELAAQSLLQTEAPFTDLRGHVHRYQEVPVVVTYHPAELLRHPEDKRNAWQDLCLARKSHQS